MKRLMTPFAIATLLLVTGCGDYDEPESRIWCDDALCGTYTASGTIAEAPSWHPDDSAVALISDGASLTRSTSEFGRCLRVVVIADVPADAEASVMVTVLDLPSMSRRLPLPAGEWISHDFEVAVSESGRVQITVEKQGAAPVTLARMYPESCLEGSRRESDHDTPW